MTNNTLFSEFFMYPINPKKKDASKNTKRNIEELDVVMIMIDSISRASAQRYMNKTYQMLHNDPSSVILKVREKLYKIKRFRLSVGERFSLDFKP